MSDHYDPYALQALETFDAGFRPEGGIRPGPEALPDGDYDCEIVDATIGRIKSDGSPIFRLVLRVHGGPKDGTTIERGSILKTQENVNRLGADLVALGLDADQWTAATGRPFSQQLPTAMAKLKGRRFAGKKVTSTQVDKNGNPYHNLYIQSLTGGATPPPSRPGTPPRPAVPSPQKFAPPPLADDDIPF